MESHNDDELLKNVMTRRHTDAEDAYDDTATPSGNRNSSRRKRAKYTKTFPTIAAQDESVRYFCTTLGTNLFDNASQVEQVLAEIAQKELSSINNNDESSNDNNAIASPSSLPGASSSSSSSSFFLGGSLTLGRWSDARQVDGLRFMVRLCPFYNTCGCTWRVKVCHNTKSGQYFVVLPIVQHQTQLHHNKLIIKKTKKKTPSRQKQEPSQQKSQQKGTVAFTLAQPVQQCNTATFSDTENTAKNATLLPRNDKVHGAKTETSQASHGVVRLDSENNTTVAEEAGQQQHAPLLVHRATRIEATLLLEVAADTNNLNTSDQQQTQHHEEMLCRAATTTTTATTDDGDVSPQTTATITAAATVAALSSSIVDVASQLAQLASMTVLGVDTGDLQLIRDFGTAVITIVATNPLFAAQQATTPAASSEARDANNGNDCSSSSLKIYTQMLESTVAYAQNETRLSKSETIAMAIDRLAVHLGKVAISAFGGTDNYYVSTRVDPRLAFDTAAMIHRGHCISQLYQSLGIGKEHVLIQLAATWEGIMAAHELETRHGIHCQLMLIFSTVQAYACAQYNVHIISPHPSDISAWHAAAARPSGTAAATNHGDNGSVVDTADKLTATSLSSISEGVIVCREIFHHVCRHGHDTICMPVIGTMNAGDQKKDDNDNDATDDCLNEIRALAGIDRMTVPIPLMRKLATCHEPLKQRLHPPANRYTTDSNKTAATTTTPTKATARTPPAVAAKNKLLLAAAKTRRMTQQEFRYRLNMDVCGTELLARGIRAWIKDVERLEKIITTRVEQDAQKMNDASK